MHNGSKTEAEHCLSQEVRNTERGSERQPMLPNHRPLKPGQSPARNPSSAICRLLFLPIQRSFSTASFDFQENDKCRDVVP